MPNFKINQNPKNVDSNSAQPLINPQSDTPIVRQSILKPIDSQTMNTSTQININSSSSSPKSDSNSMKKNFFPIIIILVILLGIGSGYILASVNGGNTGTASLIGKDNNLKREVNSGEIQVGTKVGVADESTFKDDATGAIEKGGIEGEGSHKLIRPGGDSQTVALTSSIIDLDQFIGRKVHVWGETMTAQKAGWFMDIGKLEVLE